jgi:cell division protein FtsB
VRLSGLKLVLLSVLAIWMAVGIAAIWGKGGYKDIRVARQKAQEILLDVTQLRKENEELKLEIKELETSPSIYEIPAREKLLLKKPGEIVIYLPPDEKENSNTKSNH